MKKILIFLLILQSFTLLYSQHDELEVDEKLQIVLSEIDDREIDNWDIPPFFERLVDLILRLNNLFRILFIILVGAIIVFTLYKLAGLFVSDKRINKGEDFKSVSSEVLPDSLSTDQFLEEAHLYSLKQQYSKAILSLHKGSVFALHNKSILNSSRDYTNREILEVIQSSSFYESFNVIALKAELIVFKGIKGESSEYEKFELLYRSTFL